MQVALPHLVHVRQDSAPNTLVWSRKCNKWQKLQRLWLIIQDKLQVSVSGGWTTYFFSRLHKPAAVSQILTPSLLSVNLPDSLSLFLLYLKSKYDLILSGVDNISCISPVSTHYVKEYLEGSRLGSWMKQRRLSQLQTPAVSVLYLCCQQVRRCNSGGGKAVVEVQQVQWRWRYSRVLWILPVYFWFQLCSSISWCPRRSLCSPRNWNVQ